MADARLAADGVTTGMIAGFLNLLAPTYDDGMDERVMLTIRDDLPVRDGMLVRLLASLEVS